MATRPPKSKPSFMLIGRIADRISLSGKPVYDAGLTDVGVNGTYVPFGVTDVRRSVESMRALGFTGFAITMPYKQTVMKYLDALDKDARAIGAVNGVIFTNGRALGYNADWIGAKRALEDVMNLRGKRVAVAGAGGAARAACFGFKKAGAKVTVYNRTAAKAKKLARDLGVTYGGTLDDLNVATYEALVNATSLGFEENARSPVTRIAPGAVVMDVVIQPVHTPLLKLAKKHGHRIVPGYKMLVHQCVAQIQRWTGKTPSYKVMEGVFCKLNHFKS